jgi:hypothetical protein
MSEDLLTKDPMNEDLLTKIQREMDERLEELRGAVDEHDRLSGELRALQDIPEPPVVREPPANVVRFPERPRLSRARIVSPKVARLMRAPRRPALERAGVVRVGAGRVGSSRGEPADEIDTEGELYEHSM